MAADSNDPKDPSGPPEQGGSGDAKSPGDEGRPPAAQPPAAGDQAAPPAAAGGPAATPPAPPAPPPPPKIDPLKEPVASVAVDLLKQRFPNAVQEVAYHAGEAMVRLSADRFVEIATFLRDEPELKMDFLSNLTAVHWPEKPMPFEVVYHLFSISKRHTLTLKLELAEGEEAPTVCGVWPTANWQEREVFDLFGIRFSDHPDMTRILMTDEWVGHPLRKDYPLEGKAEDHVQYREVVTADHVYRFEKAPLSGFGWKKKIDKTGEGKG